MVSTIQVNDSTIELLKYLKERLHSKTYDELIKKLIYIKIPTSMYGTLVKKKKKYTVKQLLKGLRYEGDRF